MYPLQAYDILDLGEGPALLLVGLLWILLYAAVQFRNPAAVISWSFVIMLVIFSGLFGIGFELVWVGILVVAIILAVGVVARWTRS